MAGEVAQGLREYTAPKENKSSDPRTHRGWSSPLITPTPVNPMPVASRGTCMHRIHIHTQSTIYIIKIISIINFFNIQAYFILVSTQTTVYFKLQCLIFYEVLEPLMFAEMDLSAENNTWVHNSLTSQKLLT